MRIIAGKYGSRKLETLDNNDTRPTLDRVKEAIFSHIGPFFDGGDILDLFSGSGNISLEAISRGFEKAVINDKNYKAIEVIKKNVNSLRINQQCEIYNLDYQTLITKLIAESRKFDLIYLDPPYKLRLISELLEKVYPLLKDDGIIVCESSLDEEITVCHDLIVEKQKKYGTINVSYIKRG